MLYRDYKGEKISQLGFGMMRLPVIDGNQSKIDYEKVEELFVYAYENGINYYDTAYPYHNGFSEKTLGRLVKEHNLRDKINIATKLFTLGVGAPEYDPKKMFEEQLDRLKTDHIDFYLVHGLHGDQWDILKEKYDIKNWLHSLKDQGVIRHLGFSFHDSYEKFQYIIDDFDWDFSQIQYNYVDNNMQAGDTGIAYARKKNVLLNIMEPLKGGNLIFPNYPQIDKIKEKYGLKNMSNAQLGLSYVFDKAGLLVVLSGMNDMQQMKENIAIANECHENMLTKNQLACIEEIRDLLEHTEHIDCTGCRYCCEGCPEQIQIPTAFSLYNEGKKFKNPQAQMRNYNRSCTNLADCAECEQCVEACPQHLPIPKLLKEVRTYFQ